MLILNGKILNLGHVAHPKVLTALRKSGDLAKCKEVLEPLDGPHGYGFRLEDRLRVRTNTQKHG